MKLTIKMLIGLLGVIVVGLFVSNLTLKKKYDRIDKSDLYWTYDRVLEQPFKYLKIVGGNITHIAFEQSANCSVRILNNWHRINEKVVQTSVKDDTLFVRFNYEGKTREETDWWKYVTAVRIFSPELLYIEGFDTDLGMFKLNQKSISVCMAGRSKFEVESSIRQLDSLDISQKDSSEVVFEMSPDNWRKDPSHGSLNIKGSSGPKVSVMINEPQNKQIKSPEAMNIRYLQVKLEGNTLLDVGHAQIDSMQLAISDSSAIVISGGALRKIHR